MNEYFGMVLQGLFNGIGSAIGTGITVKYLLEHLDTKKIKKIARRLPTIPRRP